MKAFTYRRYGSPDVLQLTELAMPVPADNEALIEIHATSINAFDWRHLKAVPFIVRLAGGGLITPKHSVLGVDVAGVVVGLGRNASRFQLGDAVFGDLSAQHFGAFAEYVTAIESDLAPIPKNLSFESAAAVPMAGCAALQALRDIGEIERAEKVLINGAAGGVGTFAVQVAKYFKKDVTAVCDNKSIDLVKSLGADKVIDYVQEDFTISGQCYDLILAVNGYHSLINYKRSLSPSGIYVMCGGATAQIFQALLLGPLLSQFGTQKLCAFSATPNSNDLATLGEMIGAGDVVPVIDKRYSFDDIPDALRYLGAGKACGKVVVCLK